MMWQVDAFLVHRTDQELAGAAGLWLLTLSERSDIANVAIVRAHGFFTAMERARALEIPPPGLLFVNAFEVHDDEIAPSLRDRLLSLTETRALLAKLAQDHCAHCGVALPLPEPTCDRLTKTEARTLLRDLAIDGR